MMRREWTGRRAARVFVTGIAALFLSLGAGAVAASAALSVGATAQPVHQAGPPWG
jgi:hypothetical protein